MNVTHLIQPNNLNILESELLTMAGFGAIAAIVKQVCTIIPRTCVYDILAPHNRRLQPLLSSNMKQSLARKLQNHVTYIEVKIELLFATSSYALSCFSIINNMNSTEWDSHLLTALILVDPVQYSGSAIIPIEINTMIVATSSIIPISAVANSTSDEKVFGLGANTIIYVGAAFGIASTLIIIGIILSLRACMKYLKRKGTIVPLNNSGNATIPSSTISGTTFSSTSMIEIPTSITKHHQWTSSIPQTCSNCHNLFMNDALFCSVCGQSRYRFRSTCSNCGTPQLPNSPYCSHCGKQQDLVMTTKSIGVERKYTEPVHELTHVRKIEEA